MKKHEQYFQLFDTELIWVKNKWETSIFVTNKLRRTFHIKTLIISKKNDKSVNLEMFEVYPTYQKKGYGKTFIYALAEWLRTKNLILCVTPNALYEKDMNEPYLRFLKNFYTKIGFVYNEGTEYKNWCSNTMYYNPE